MAKMIALQQLDVVRTSEAMRLEALRRPVQEMMREAFGHRPEPVLNPVRGHFALGEAERLLSRDETPLPGCRYHTESTLRALGPGRQKPSLPWQPPHRRQVA